jgi:hypothetical protein
MNMAYRGYGPKAAAQQKVWRQKHPESGRASRKKWRDNNPELNKQIQLAWVKKNPTKTARFYWWRKNGINITLKEFEAMREAQNACCKICGRHESEFMQVLHVDHDHVTGKIRGLLCYDCNRALGQFKDNLERVRSAVKYLEANQ